MVLGSLSHTIFSVYILYLPPLENNLIINMILVTCENKKKNVTRNMRDSVRTLVEYYVIVYDIQRFNTSYFVNKYFKLYVANDWAFLSASTYFETWWASISNIPNEHTYDFWLTFPFVGI